MKYDQAMSNPSQAFSSPSDVLDAPGLSRQQKLDVLRQWEYDAREKEVAEEENMGGGPGDLLPKILEALEKLDGHPGATDGPAGKQGGE